MWQEPNCDMDLDVYKDWLYEFNKNDELRNVDFYSLISGNWVHWYETSQENCYHYVDVFSPFEGFNISRGVSGHEEGQGEQMCFHDIEIINFYEYGNGAHRSTFSEFEQLLGRTITGCGIW